MNRLREIRKQKGLSQLDLMRATGIAPTDISALERGRSYPWPGWRKKLAKVLDVSEEVLFPEVNKDCVK